MGNERGKAKECSEEHQREKRKGFGKQSKHVMLNIT